MKAILEFNLPEDEQDHKYALAGCSALICISDILEEICYKLKYDSGYFEDCDGKTLEMVREYIIDLKQHRELPELH